MPRRRREVPKEFPLARRDINSELSSRASLASRILHPTSDDGGGVDDGSGTIFTPVTGLSTVQDADGGYDGVPVVQPDGTYRINVTVQWTDQAGAEEYEVWVSDAT